MTVTKIQEITKLKSKVYIDYEFAFVLYKGELRTLKIREEAEVPEDVYLNITTKILPKRAKLRCMNLLKSREYTEYQLRNKLRQGEYAPEMIEEAISYVKSYHYVDDLSYSRKYIESRINQKSIQEIENCLLIKGISRELIKQCVEELETDTAFDREESELILIQQLFRKKHFIPQEANEKERQKMYAFLYRKGFSSRIIRKVFTSA